MTASQPACTGSSAVQDLAAMDTPPPAAFGDLDLLGAVTARWNLRADGFRVEFSKEDQGLGRDAVLCVKALARTPAQWTSALASVNSTPSAAA